MANGGWYGTKGEWERLEAPLLGVDSVFEEFASATDVALTKNLKDWPERSLSWDDGIRCLIQLYLENQKDITFNLWLCAAFQKGDKQYWRQQFLLKDKPVEEFQRELTRLLHEGRTTLLEWLQHPEAFDLVGN